MTKVLIFLLCLAGGILILWVLALAVFAWVTVPKDME